MNCPKCGHPVKDHAHLSRWFDCDLLAHEATRLAQRRKAAERVKENDRPFDMYFWQGYFDALTDTGILAPGETEQDLLKELEKTGA